MDAPRTAYGFRVARAPKGGPGGWAWSAYDAGGRLLEKGFAPNRAAAAACVIRVFARGQTAGEPAAMAPAAS